MSAHVHRGDRASRMLGSSPTFLAGVFVVALVGALAVGGVALGATPVGGEFQVNTTTEYFQGWTSERGPGLEAATDADGNFVVVWHAHASMRTTLPAAVSIPARPGFGYLKRRIQSSVAAEYSAAATQVSSPGGAGPGISNRGRVASQGGQRTVAGSTDRPQPAQTVGRISSRSSRSHCFMHNPFGTGVVERVSRLAR